MSFWCWLGWLWWICFSIPAEGVELLGWLRQLLHLFFKYRRGWQPGSWMYCIWRERISRSLSSYLGLWLLLSFKRWDLLLRGLMQKQQTRLRGFTPSQADTTPYLDLLCT